MKRNQLTQEERNELLLAAARGFNAQGVLEALQHGADVHTQDDFQQTPLHYAAATGCLACLKALLDAKARPDDRDANSRTALHFAGSGTDASVVQRLIEAGADINVSDNKGDTPLHRAVRSEYPPVIRALIEAGGDMGRANQAGKTPFDLSKEGGADLVKLIERAMKGEKSSTALAITLQELTKKKEILSTYAAPDDDLEFARTRG